jgi:signal transduction histidine kinase
LRQRTDDLSDSLEQQTATSDALQVISSSPGELEPVFATILEKAVRICGAHFGNIFQWDGSAFALVATHNTPPAFAEARKRLPYVHKKVAQIVDATKWPGYVDRSDPAMIAAVELGGVRTVLAIPMLKDDEHVGALVVYRREARPFSEKQIGLLTNLAAQAVIAIENARLLGELRQRTDELWRSVGELKALGEVSQAVNSTLDLETVLATIVTKAVQLSGTDAGAIYVFDERQREFYLRSTYGMNQELIAALRQGSVGLDDPNLALAMARGEPIQVADAQSPLNEIILRAGFRARLVAPLIHGGEVVGMLVVRRRTPGAFAANTVDLMRTFAAQSVLAIQNARLFHEIEDKSHQIEAASKHKSQFLANMSHELRTPLNAILGYTELILDSIYGEAPEKMRSVLERVQANGRHLLGLINDVLDLSKIEAGQLTLSLSEYSIAELVPNVYVAVEPLASQKNLTLTTDVPKGLPIGYGDERRLAQVLLNLVGNAIKFTETGEVAITASQTNGSFNVAVRDSGPGIDPANQAKIFEEFQQVDNTSTRQKGGSGLGLAISKRIIEMHGGRIIVDSALGKGATFTIKLPVKTDSGASLA